MYGDKAPAPEPHAIVAEVYGEPLTLAQLNRYEAEQDALAGRDKPQAARRASMLMELVRQKLVRIRTRYNSKQLPDCRAKAEQEISRLATRAADDDAFDAWLKGQGYADRKQYTDRLTTRLQSAALLERAVAPHCEVSDEEVEQVYARLADELPMPASRTVSHIFLETLHKDPATVRQQAEELLQRVQRGEDFAALAREHSQDANTAPRGGLLGRMDDTTTRPLPELPLFGDNAIPPATPTLVQSKWGWHILLAGDIAPARKLTADECRQSIRSAIASVRREQALDAWYKSALKEGFFKKRIKTNVK